MDKKYSLEIPMAVFGTDGFAVSAGWVMTYTATPDREYFRAWREYVAVGTTLPAMAYTDAPALPSESGKAVRRTTDGKAWEIVPDYRGHTVYSTETGAPKLVTEMGDLPATLTLQVPQTQYDNWDGTQWVTDKEAQHAAEVLVADAKLKQLHDEADEIIERFRRAVKYDMATDDETTQLEAWERYSVLLGRVNTAVAPDVSWPVKPE
ncbi:tail fiber assembly protein [Serratia marcescens]|uniref:tail fiber assembly protein n=1 Tax=Serratia marcescens TaxID=615 RepID=UPI0013DB69FD|nr:tail fiber assembly protein [Serratia marcescens]